MLLHDNFVMQENAGRERYLDFISQREAFCHLVIAWSIGSGWRPGHCIWTLSIVLIPYHLV